MDEPKTIDKLQDYLIVTNTDSEEVRCVHEDNLVVLWHEVDEDWAEKDHDHSLTSPDDNCEISDYLMDVNYIVSEPLKWFPGNGEF